MKKIVYLLGILININIHGMAPNDKYEKLKNVYFVLLNPTNNLNQQFKDEFDKIVPFLISIDYFNHYDKHLPSTKLFLNLVDYLEIDEDKDIKDILYTLGTKYIANNTSIAQKIENFIQENATLHDSHKEELKKIIAQEKISSEKITLALACVEQELNKSNPKNKE